VAEDGLESGPSPICRCVYDPVAQPLWVVHHRGRAL